jgi:hydrogenase maturation protease
MSTRVIGIGQTFAGDDGVGYAVTAELRARNPEGLEIADVHDATELIDALARDGRVIVVDAVLGANEGRVHRLRADALATSPVRPLSSHGMSVTEAIELACALYDARADLFVVGIEIARPVAGTTGLSPNVARAIGEAADAVLALAGEG